MQRAFSIFLCATGYWEYLAAVAVLGNSGNAFIILKATSIGIPTKLTVIACAAFSFVAAAVSYPAGDLSDRWGRKQLFALALLIFVLAHLGFASAATPVIMVGVFVLYGAYQGVFRAVEKRWRATLFRRACAQPGMACTPPRLASALWWPA